jgi:hypothetical protein
MKTITEQFNLIFDKAALILSNDKEFKDNFILLCCNNKGVIFADKNLNSHYILYHNRSKEIEIIKTF